MSRGSFLFWSQKQDSYTVFLPWGGTSFLRTAAKVFCTHLNTECPQQSAHNVPSVKAHQFGSWAVYLYELVLSLNCKTLEAGESFLCVPSELGQALPECAELYPTPH